MNKQSRKLLRSALDDVTAALDVIRGIAEEERDKFDNLSEGLQQTENGQKLYDTADEMDTAIGNIESAIGDLEEFT